MRFQRFDPSRCDFPEPRVPVLPAFGWQSFEWGRHELFSPLNLDTEIRWYTRGRYALRDAYAQAGVGEHSSLLAPAYHCRTMLDPAFRLGAEIGLYSLKSDLTPNMETLGKSLASCKKPVKALLATHYFGFPQALEALAVFCAEHGIALIEDCSHAMFPGPGAIPIGTTGDYGITSPYKFFPCEDGGALWSNNGATLPNFPQRSRSLIRELKGALHSVQRAQVLSHLLDIKTLDAEVDALKEHHLPTGSDIRESAPQLSNHYDKTEEPLENLAWSRWIMRHTKVASLISRRRDNYRKWLETVASLPNCRALYTSLSSDWVPYMFPLFLDQPEVHFYALKRLGVPVWRWDDMAVSECSVASSYRLHLVHLPCHQELTTDQMTWMTSAVSTVMRQLPGGVSL